MSDRPEESAQRFLAPLSDARSEVREKGSRFLGILCPAVDDAGAEARLRELRAATPDATHHCWAYRLGWPARERCSDDGEPVGTAGGPILRVLAGREISDVLLVVVRWFGGTRLGKGGLARAYAAAASAAADAASLAERVPTVVIAIGVPYDRLGAVKRLVRPPFVELESASYGVSVRLELRVTEAVREETVQALADLGIVPD